MTWIIASLDGRITALCECIEDVREEYKKNGCSNQTHFLYRAEIDYALEDELNPMEADE